MRDDCIPCLIAQELVLMLQAFLSNPINSTRLRLQGHKHIF